MADNKDDDDFGDDFDGDFTPATIKTLKLDESDDSNELNDAIAALEAKVSADSSNADLKSQLAKAYINGAEAALLDSDSQVAQGFLNKALALDANNPAVLFDLSRAYQLEEDHAKARDFLKQTLAKDPKHARALFQLGTYAQDEKKNDEALDFFEQAAAADSTFAAAFHNAGQIRQSRNSGDDLKQAAELFAKAAAADPSDFQYHAKLIQLYDSLGNADAREAARQNFKAAFDKGELNPNFLAVGRYNGAQLEVGDKFVMVFGHFKLLGSEPAKYQFVVYDKGQVREDKELYRVSLLVKDGKFLLDSFSSKERKHFKEYSSEPSYENVKQDVLSIINGATQPVSTTAL